MPKMKLAELVPIIMERFDKLPEGKVLRLRDEGLKNHWFVSTHERWFANVVLTSCTTYEEICEWYKKYGCDDNHITTLAIHCCKAKGWL